MALLHVFRLLRDSLASLEMHRSGTCLTRKEVHGGALTPTKLPAESFQVTAGSEGLGHGVCSHAHCVTHLAFATVYGRDPPGVVLKILLSHLVQHC